MSMSYVKVNKMRHIENVNEIKDVITTVKSNGDEWYTNYFVSDDVVERWIKNRQIMMFRDNTTVFLLRRRKNFFLIYFFSSSIDGFVSCLNNLVNSTEVTLSVDVLYKKETPIEECLLQKGFSKRAGLYRMRLGNYLQMAEGLSNVCYAEINDAENIEDMLNDEFDELCEQIPEKEEIERAVASEQIIVLKDNKEIVSLLWIEKRGAIATVRYWITDNRYRGRGAGTCVLNQALSLHSDARQIFVWVKENNYGAIKEYEKTGFVRDGLRDDVYCFIR